MKKKPAIKKISPMHQIGLTWKDDEGRSCRTRAVLNEAGKREAMLSITSFGGLSPGAMHYYAIIRVGCPHWTVGRSGSWHGGYGGKSAPNLEQIYLEATRVLTQVELDGHQEPLGNIGQSTVRFNTRESAFAAAVKLFKDRFARGWVLCRDCWDVDEKRIVAET